MANGKFVWTPSGGTQESYVFPVNFSWGYEEAQKEAGDFARALDGTLRGYRRAYKQRWFLEFLYIELEQKEQFREIKQAGVDIDFYREADGSRTGVFAWVNDFDFAEVAPGMWSGTIELEEV